MPELACYVRLAANTHRNPSEEATRRPVRSKAGLAPVTVRRLREERGHRR